MNLQIEQQRRRNETHTCIWGVVWVSSCVVTVVCGGQMTEGWGCGASLLVDLKRCRIHVAHTHTATPPAMPPSPTISPPPHTHTPKPAAARPRAGRAASSWRWPRSRRGSCSCSSSSCWRRPRPRSSSSQSCRRRPRSTPWGRRVVAFLRGFRRDFRGVGEGFRRGLGRDFWGVGEGFWEGFWEWHVPVTNSSRWDQILVAPYPLLSIQRQPAHAIHPPIPPPTPTPAAATRAPPTSGCCSWRRRWPARSRTPGWSRWAPAPCRGSGLGFCVDGLSLGGGVLVVGPRVHSKWSEWALLSSNTSSTQQHAAPAGISQAQMRSDRSPVPLPSRRRWSPGQPHPHCCPHTSPKLSPPPPPMPPQNPPAAVDTLARGLVRVPQAQRPLAAARHLHPDVVVGHARLAVAARRARAARAAREVGGEAGRRGRHLSGGGGGRACRARVDVGGGRGDSRGDWGGARGDDGAARRRAQHPVHHAGGGALHRAGGRAADDVADEPAGLAQRAAEGGGGGRLGGGEGGGEEEECGDGVECEARHVGLLWRSCSCDGGWGLGGWVIGKGGVQGRAARGADRESASVVGVAGVDPKTDASSPHRHRDCCTVCKYRFARTWRCRKGRRETGWAVHDAGQETETRGRVGWSWWTVNNDCDNDVFVVGWCVEGFERGVKKLSGSANFADHAFLELSVSCANPGHVSPVVFTQMWFLDIFHCSHDWLHTVCVK